MDWKLSIKHLISGFIPVVVVLALYFLFLLFAYFGRTERRFR